MNNLITKYTNFLLEEEGVNTKIEQAKVEIAKVFDEVQIAKQTNKRTNQRTNKQTKDVS